MWLSYLGIVLTCGCLVLWLSCLVVVLSCDGLDLRLSSLARDVQRTKCENVQRTRITDGSHRIEPSLFHLYKVQEMSTPSLHETKDETKRHDCTNRRQNTKLKDTNQGQTRHNTRPNYRTSKRKDKEKTREGKTKQDQTRPDQTGQNKTRQGQARSEQNRTEQT